MTTKQKNTSTSIAEDISEDTLATDWTLTPQDIHFILMNAQGHSHNYLRFATHLCVLRKTGRFLRDYQHLPAKALAYLAQQLECEAIVLLTAFKRPNTEYVYREKIKDYLQFKSFNKKCEKPLKKWLIMRLYSKEYSPDKLLVETESFLLSHKILLPTPTQLGRKIVNLRTQIHKELYQKIANKMSSEQRMLINKLLITRGDTFLSALTHYKSSPPEPSSKIINDYLDRLDYLKQLNIMDVDLSDVPLSVINDFAQLTNTYNAWDLRRVAPDTKRYALLICFLTEAHKTLLDQLIELNDKLLLKKERIARNEFESQIKIMRYQAKESHKILIQSMSKLLEHPKAATTTIDQFLKQETNILQLHQAVMDCQTLADYEEAGVLGELIHRRVDLRKYTTRFFHLDFKAAQGSEHLLKGIELLQQLDQDTVKFSAKQIETAFIPQEWRAYFVKQTETQQQAIWELALYYAVRKALQSGDLYLKQARHHRNFWETVYKEEDWQEQKAKAYADLHFPARFDQVLTLLKLEFEQSVQMAEVAFKQIDSFAYLNRSGELKLRRDDALEIPESTQKLRFLIEEKLPVIRIENLLAEVDQLINFAEHFTPPIGYSAKQTMPRYLLHAALIAHATNVGLYGMANSAEEFTIDELRHTSRWLIRYENLKASNTELINRHYQLPLSQLLGDSRHSSSDGQRYGIRQSALLASYYPRYFGYYDKAISIYTHMSNQYSVFNTQVISCGVREALYVLDGLLLNDTLLNIESHSTDSHGYTYHVFALCYLLGFSFQPRLKDLASQRLFKIDKQLHYGELDTLFYGVANLTLVEEQWDSLIRIAASLKNQLAPAHVIVQKLATRVASDKASKALIELGKIIKTIFILRYISDTELRYKIHLQLNRGESRHALAQHTFFADQGVFKTRDYQEIMNKASCLSFISNAVLYWNTVQFERIVKQLKAEGHQVQEIDISRISPLMFKHVIMHGMYRFNKR